MKKLLGLPIDASGQGAGVDNLIYYVHILMAVLFVGWLAYFGYVIVRFRKSRNPKADYVGVKNHASSYMEGIVAIIEGVLLIGFAIPLWAGAVRDFPKEKDSTVIRIVAQQFLWNGWYPNTNGTFGSLDKNSGSLALDQKDPNTKGNFLVVNDLVVPVKKPVLVHISSRDVIHCFAVKPMRVTQDAIPGLSIPAWFQPMQEGTYQINCAQLCGNFHYHMRGTLKVVSEAKYAEWVASKSKSAASSAGGYE